MDGSIHEWDATYSLYKAMSYGDESSSYAFRSSIKFNAVTTGWYSNASLDPIAEEFGSSVRDLWRSTDNMPYNQTWVTPYLSSPGDFPAQDKVYLLT